MNEGELDTLRLVRAAQAGDPGCMDRLFERYLPRVRQIVALRLGRSQRDLATSDDMVQEALLRVFQNLDRFGETSEGTFRNWVATCVANSIRNHIRGAKAKKRGGDRVQYIGNYESGVLASNILAGKDPSPSAVERGRELLEMIEQVLLAMEERDREVILLRRLCEMSYEEVARELGLSDAVSARQVFHRSIKRLRDRIGAEALDDL